jgi:hypothetical protein
MRCLFYDQIYQDAPNEDWIRSESYDMKTAMAYESTTEFLYDLYSWIKRDVLISSYSDKPRFLMGQL